jgi:hypothetical protein
MIGEGKEEKLYWIIAGSAVEGEGDKGDKGDKEEFSLLSPLSPLSPPSPPSGLHK